jgi:ATP-dependent Clp protease ATP-binding subunit ClpA
VLLDEIEKAHPDVFNILLQVLDDGRLTDSKGRTVNFTNTIVILTTNIASDKIQEMMGESEKKAKEKRSKIETEVGSILEKESIFAELKKYFRPEFINRIDDVIIFEPLRREQIRSIVDVQLGSVLKRLADKGIVVKVSDAAKDWLGDNGYDAAYGARPLKRLIQSDLLDPLAMKLIDATKKDKPSYTVDVKGGLMDSFKPPASDKERNDIKELRFELSEVDGEGYPKGSPYEKVVAKK